MKYFVLIKRPDGMKANLLYIFLLITSGWVYAQEPVNFVQVEDSLLRIAPDILNARSDSHKISANEQFLRIFKRALQQEGSYTYPFDKLQTIANLKPADNKFRIFNWNRPLDDGTYKYYCIVQTAPSKKQSSRLFIIESIVEKLPQPEMTTLNINNWYGAHYYTIISIKSKGKWVYTLLGWDGNSRFTTKKIIDVMHFTDAGVPKFGLPIFKIDNKLKSRLIFEYQKMAVMSVKYYAKRKRIVVDHLSAPNASLEGNPQFMAPDGSYDAYHFKKGRWLLEKDFDAKNDKSIIKKKYNAPEKIK